MVIATGMPMTNGMGMPMIWFFVPMVMATGMPMANAMGVPMTMCTGTSTIGKHASGAPKRAFRGPNGPFWGPQECHRGPFRGPST